MPTNIPVNRILTHHQFRKIRPLFLCFIWIDVYSDLNGIVKKVEAKGFGADILCGFVFGWKDVTERTRFLMELLIDD